MFGLLAASLIQQENEKNRYFSDSARMVLECMILFLLARAGRDSLSFENLFDLAFVISLLGLPLDPWQRLGWARNHGSRMVSRSAPRGPIVPSDGRS